MQNCKIQVYNKEAEIILKYRNVYKKIIIAWSISGNTNCVYDYYIYF